MKVSILGAAGAMGRATVDALRRRDIPLRVVGRSRARLEAAYSRFGADVEIVTADLTTDAGCEVALRGADAAVYTLGVEYSARAFEAYPPMMEVCLAAARAVGLERLLLVTNVYPYGHPRSPRVDEAHPREPCSRKGELRKIQEDLLLGAHGPDLLAASIRFPDFYGPHAEVSLTHRMFEAALVGGVADLIGPVDVPHEYFYVPDGGEVLARFLLQERGWGRGWNCGGAGTLTQREFTEQVFAAFGAKPRVRVAGPLMLRALALFVPILRETITLSPRQLWNPPRSRVRRAIGGVDYSVSETVVEPPSIAGPEGDRRGRVGGKWGERARDRGDVAARCGLQRLDRA